MKTKPCKKCGELFTINSPAQLYCASCKEVRKQEEKEEKRRDAYQRWCNKQIEAGREDRIGVGKGGSQPIGEDSPNYKDGIGIFHTQLKPIVYERGFCERCNADLRKVSEHYRCVHHRDHDRSNNVLENLELLCKRCHQIEHKCWEAFEGAETIRKE